VEDDGPGFPEAERAYVVERFHRVKGTPGAGAGLGLAIVREIAHRHGASVTLGAGAHGRGTRVSLSFLAA
jgi:signal transduction histidine kinase